MRPILVRTAEMRRTRGLAVALALAIGAVPPARAQTPADTGEAARWERIEAMVPMRDGAKLYTIVFVPKERRGPMPILFLRTPYGVGPGRVNAMRGPYKELAEDGYAFAFQDIRGKYRSEGTFVMQRPPRASPGGIDEASDAYDTVDWLVKHVPGNNGRVGMHGVSYDGWTTAMALLDPHPALRAASPQASPADMWLGDDFHHNGAFRLSYGFEYATMMESEKGQKQFAFDTYDTYDWYLRLGPLSNVNAKYLRGTIPTWNDYVAHPDYDAFWQRQTIVRHLTKPLTVPTLNVAGWWDQEDFYGPLAIYQALEKRDARGLNTLVVGPWNHGGWNRSEGRALGRIDFGGPTSLDFRRTVLAPFFRCHLRDDGDACTKVKSEATVFESGTNRWRTFDAWPPKSGVTRRNLYFREGGKLSFEPPRAGVGRGVSGVAGNTPRPTPNAPEYDSYVSDPANPVPYRARPIEATYHPQGSGWYTWQVEDQRFVHGRPDVLSWVTEPLTEDVVIAGDVIAELRAATTGTDADWVVKLIDVYPDADSANLKMSGYQLMVSGEVFRGRYREGYERPKPIAAGAVLPYRVDLHGQSYAFRRGHRIMVQVQSSWFPVIDRNPQTFVPNIFLAKAEDYRPATQRVYRSPAAPSHVSLPVLEPARP
jgi:uncharacterized protein